MMKSFFNVTTGFAGIVSFIISLILLYFALTSEIKTDMLKIMYLLSGTIATLSFSVIILFVFHFRESVRFSTLSKSNYILEENLKRKDLIVYYSAEYLHNISHYFRNLICKIESLENENMLEDNLGAILTDYEMFFNTLSSNLQSYFTLLTVDHCNITIKIAKYNEGQISTVKTFHRDAISYRKRKKTDRDKDGNVKKFEIEENTAYDIISSKEWKNTSFLCNNLEDRYNNGDYTNQTPGWKNYYNACAVVGIRTRAYNKNKQILGFLCVDNFSGKLDNPTVENYLNGIADILSILFDKYDKIIKLAISKGIESDKVRIYTNWD